MQRFFVDASMQAYFGSRRFCDVDVNTVKDLRAMLESCNSYVRSYVTSDEQLKSQSVSLELQADRQLSTTNFLA